MEVQFGNLAMWPRKPSRHTNAGAMHTDGMRCASERQAGTSWYSCQAKGRTLYEAAVQVGGLGFRGSL